MIQLSKIVVFFSLVGAFSGIMGCSKSETPQLKPEIIRKKISEKPETIKPLPAAEGGATSMPVPAALPPKSPPDATRADAITKQTVDETLKVSAGEMAVVSVSYNPVGKIDPFVPLLRDEPAKPQQAEKIKKEKREPMTPLERVDLSQLKLTAIIRTPSGLKAMVEESTGKGYIVGMGTYMGIHSGKVVNILKDRVVVEEEIDDAQGNVVNRNSELKFQKPSGD
jgi:type IV pilus assembly protein PilP